MKTNIQNIRNRVIKQSNALTEAAYSLSRDGKRILYSCLHNNKPKANDFGIECVFTIDLQVFKDTFKYTTRKEAAHDIRGALDSMSSKFVKFYIPEEDSADEKATENIPWLGKARSSPKRGIYEVELNPNLMEYLFGSEGNFTLFRLEEAGELQNPKAIRLYELLCKYRDQKEYFLYRERVMERFQLPPSYEKLSHFRKKFLDIAIAEINKKTNMTIDEPKETKKGRKVIGFLLTFKEEAKNNKQ